MLRAFEGIRQNFKLKPQAYSIDNWIFQLHYRVTTLCFLVATVLVTSRQYIGEHIRCINDDGVPSHVMNTFCFFTSTFTVIRHLDSKLLDAENLAHPGVGPIGIGSDEPVVYHAYYQWVPFVLFGQALMFYAPHLLWKVFEGRRLKRLCEGLKLAAFAVTDDEIQVRDTTIPSKKEREHKINLIRRAFMERLYIGQSWSRGLILCEVLNFLNVILQVYITNKFLNGRFLELGVNLLKYGYDASVDELEVVFPKVTKCTFHKYGPSGTIQAHDAMCVMALNIINEKIYTFFWFWFVLLFAATALGLIWRFVTVCLHAKSHKFNEMVFALSCPGKLNPWRVLTVTRHCNYTDWLFLKYLSKNMDSMIFRDLFIGLAEELSPMEKKVDDMLESDYDGHKSD